MLEGEIAIDDPRATDVRELLGRHLVFARAVTPPEDAHALEPDELVDPAVTLFSFRAGGALLGVAALKHLDDRHAEIKSMHTTEEARGYGVGGALLGRLLATARERGFERVSLETGAMPAFAPARRLYAGAGFTPGPAFGDYRESPNTVFMTLSLRAAGAKPPKAARRAGSGLESL